ncbi:MAG: DNA adenine methylase [Thermomicrobiales bacterium]|nr:DNA adenine methylase [Thermomicrobiales bacterium]
MIKYLGSKRKLLPHILQQIESLPDVTRICDLFTGTTRVAQACKRNGIYVIANDLASYSAVMARAYIATDASATDVQLLQDLLDHLNTLPGIPGYVTRTFCEDARYFHPRNGARIDAIRAEIDRLELTENERAITLTALLLAADKVDSTTGVQMAYLKQWASRAMNDLELKLPELIAGAGEVYQQDAIELARSGGTRDVDLTYIDPPYNQHSYAGNYHVWETLVRNDAPDSYGIARKRADIRGLRNPWNSKPRFRQTLTDLLTAVESRYLLMSFSNEGFVPTDQMERLLGDFGCVTRTDVDFRRYIGAQIGVHNPAGERVGTVSHTRNVEHLFLVDRG